MPLVAGASGNLGPPRVLAGCDLGGVALDAATAALGAAAVFVLGVLAGLDGTPFLVGCLEAGFKMQA